MTLQEFVTKYNGKIVADGQCGNLVRAYWNEVDKTTPPSYTNSKDYWFNPVPGYDKVHDPQPGDIAIYNGHGAYTEGHSAIYVDGRVFEQNADPDGSPAHLYTRNNTYLLGYLRKQGQGVPMLNDEITKYLYGAFTGREPNQGELDSWRGRETNSLVTTLVTSKEANQRYAEVQAALKGTAQTKLDQIKKIVS